MRMLPLSLLLLAVGVATVGARAAMAADPDPCVLVSQAEAERALGKATTRVQPKVGGSGSCVYQASGGLDRVTITLYPEGDARYDERLDDAHHTWKATAVPVAELGDRAAWVGRQLFVGRKPHLLAITIVSRESADDSLKHAKDLARTALGRLP